MMVEADLEAAIRAFGKAMENVADVRQASAATPMARP
jgi:hypothetical protein